MPQSIPPGLTKVHVVQALKDLDSGIDHPFGAPTGYELVHDGKRYAPKAVVGLACWHFLGRVLQPEEFSGGEAPGQANFVLRKLGFTVVRTGEEPAEEEKPAHKDSTEQEVGLIVGDYFTMLENELLGKPFSKSEHRRSLSPQLHGRSDGSIEFTYANISAVLTERHRFFPADRADLSRKVQWVPAKIADGPGFDVLSFDDQDESEKLVEMERIGGIHLLRTFFYCKRYARRVESSSRSGRQAAESSGGTGRRILPCLPHLVQSVEQM